MSNIIHGSNLSFKDVNNIFLTTVVINSEFYAELKLGDLEGDDGSNMLNIFENTDT